MNAVLESPPKSVSPSPMAPPTPHRFSIAEYRKLYETGFYFDKKTMLIDGELYVMPMPGPPHNVGVLKTNRWLNRIFGDGYVVLNQMGFDIGTRNDPGPDLAVVRGEIDDFTDRMPSEAELIVEIADSSLAIDTGKKAILYATAGVPDYWVLDVDNRQLHIFREPQAGTYASHQILNESDSAAPLAAPTANVTVKDLLPVQE